MLDVQIAAEDGEYYLRWQAHDSGARALPSGRGERRFASEEAADAAAETLFGIAPDAWPFNAPGRSLTSADIAELVRLELAPYEERGLWLDEAASLVEPPRLEQFATHDGHVFQLWLVARCGDYVVFYDEESGEYGLGSDGGNGTLAYIGDYGPLWLALASM